MTSKALKKAINSLPPKVDLSQTERATKYIEEASRIRLQDIKDNPGAKVAVRSNAFTCLKLFLGTFAQIDVSQSMRTHYRRTSACSKAPNWLDLGRFLSSMASHVSRRTTLQRRHQFATRIHASIVIGITALD